MSRIFHLQTIITGNLESKYLFLSSLYYFSSIVSDSVRPHRRQPTRLPCPWDSPGKNTGVDCHFLLQCVKVKSESEVAQSCPTRSSPMDCSLPGSSIHGISRQEYWSGVPLPSPKFCQMMHLVMEEDSVVQCKKSTSEMNTGQVTLWRCVLFLCKMMILCVRHCAGHFA